MGFFLQPLCTGNPEETVGVQPCIHILDCTKTPGDLDNENYEESTVVKIDGESTRGFLSQEISNYLKRERKVDTYIPAKENMILYEDAVQLAVSAGAWKKHPNKKRKT